MSHFKVELIPAPNETPFVSNPAAQRYRVRVNGRLSTKVKDVTLTEAFNRLRHWLVARARRVASGGNGLVSPAR
jgi:hypothetical protein